MAWLSNDERDKRSFAALQAATAEWQIKNAIEPGDWVVKSHPRAPYWSCVRGTPLNIGGLRVQAPVSAKFLSGYADSWVA